MSESEVAAGFLLVGKKKSGPKSTKTNSLTEQGLLAQRLADAKAGAFEDFYRKFVPFVHAIVLSRVPFPDSEDVVQEVFVAAFKSIDGLRDKNAIGPWLARVATNKSIEYHRRRKPTEELIADVKVRRVPSEEAREALEAIRSMPAAYRETLMMRLVEGLTGPEISILTGKTEASVRVNLHRGMKMLRKKLGIKESKR